MAADRLWHRAEAPLAPTCHICCHAHNLHSGLRQHRLLSGFGIDLNLAARYPRTRPCFKLWTLNPIQPALGRTSCCYAQRPALRVQCCRPPGMAASLNIAHNFSVQDGAFAVATNMREGSHTLPSETHRYPAGSECARHRPPAPIGKNIPPCKWPAPNTFTQLSCVPFCAATAVRILDLIAGKADLHRVRRRRR